MAMACFGFVTFLPLRPDFSFPRFISCISLSTFLPAEGEYLRLEDFLALDFLALDFRADDPRVLFRALLLLELLDFFLAAFLVAITILLAGQMRSGLRQVACGRTHKGHLGKTAIEPKHCANRECCIKRCGEFQGCAPADQRSATWQCM